MNGKIFVNASEVWDYFCKHSKELHNEAVTIAVCDDFGVEISMTEEEGLPLAIVTVDDEEVTEEIASTEKECEEMVLGLYDEYLSDSFLSSFIESSIDAETERLDMIDEREGELDDAIGELLSTLTVYVHICSEDVDELCDDIKEHLCEYLFQKHGISVYRPMYLECEDGSEEFFEFPYDEMDFDN